MTTPSADAARSGLDTGSARRAFEWMLLIRHFEERTAELCATGEFPGIAPVYVGQEATAAAAGGLLQTDDLLFGTHRNHGHLLARGADPRRLLAEVFGKADGYCGGRGGSMHAAYPEVGVPISSAVLGGSACAATGAAMAFRQRGEPRVVVACLGERALSEGACFETLNLAAWWQAPVIFLCENNDAIPYRTDVAMLAVDRFTRVAEPFRLHVASVDGADLWAVDAVLREAFDRARSGGGPTFVEALTVRWPGGGARRGHGTQPTRTRLAAAWEPPDPTDDALWRTHEPLARTARRLVDLGAATREVLLHLEQAAVATVDDAVAFARAAPYPDSSVALSGVFA